VKAKTAYIDGELCGLNDAGLPSFAQTQAAIDGERGGHLVYYAFDLLHFDGRDTRGCRSLSARRFLSHWSRTSAAFNSSAMR
jgi:bifunctional non-homologous end joining protein LigD